MAKLMYINGVKEFSSLQSRSCYLVSVEKLIELARGKCAVSGEGNIVYGTTNVGSALEIAWKCENGHYKWLSSEVLMKKKNTNFQLNDAM